MAQPKTLPRYHYGYLKEQILRTAFQSWYRRSSANQLLGRRRGYRCWAGSVILLVEENGDIYPNGG